MEYQELIEMAKAVIRPKRIGDHLVGNVGSALLTDQGHVFVGVCIDVSSGMGFCAEHSAIAAMVTAGEYRIQTIVAVWKESEEAYILAPCGRCREFMHQIDSGNLQADVILDTDKSVKLAELLPQAVWYQKITNIP